jgi:Tfp pilus assembly protein PilO
VARLVGVLSARTQGVVFILLACSLLAGIWRGRLAPDRLLLESRRSKLTASAAELSRLRGLAAGLPGLQREVRTFEARLAAMTPASPQSEEPGQILAALDTLATQSGVEIAAFSAAPSASGNDPKQPRFQLGLEGSFHGIVTFLDGLVSLGRVGPIVELTIKPEPKAGGRPVAVATVVAEMRPGGIAIVASASVPETDVLATGRDPFLDQGSGGDRPALSTRGATAGRVTTGGLGAVSVDDVIVTGIVRAGDDMTAILQGASRQPFVARPRDRLLDAIVTGIDRAGVMFLKQTPGKTKSEVVRKSLNKSAGAVR